MPVSPNIVTYTTLLSACRLHRNVGLAEQIAERALQIDPKDASIYVLLANTYAMVGSWNDQARIREQMKERRIKKIPGISQIQIEDKVHSFTVEDKSHPRTAEIYANLQQLNDQMKKAGYVPDINWVMHDVGEEQKETLLCYHRYRIASCRY
jgi:hypothetical protein